MGFEKNKIDSIKEIDITKEDLNKILRLMVSSRKRFKLSCTGKSMFPFFHNCDFIEIEPVNLKDIKIGDVILYYNKNLHLTAHRVVKKICENKLLRIITKGDFASSIDKPVEKDNFIGKIVAVNSKNRFIPSYLGINRHLGFMIAKISLISLYIWPFLKLLSRLTSFFCKAKNKG